MKAVSREELKELYDKDFPLWVDINLQFLREKAYDLVDWENLLEEIEDMGRRYLDARISYFAIILEHFYKWDNFKNLAGAEGGKSWIRSVENSRTRIRAMLKEYPSLRNELPSEIERAWVRAQSKLEIRLRNNDYDSEDFNAPEKCPYNYEEAMKGDLKEELK